ncbi:MAG: cell division protein FtsI/penicillin-binding protein 2 [Bacteriovoracaceae bacterium]|jgi:cell division protein FtsI/penicillin-binding protein 2
MRKVAILLVLVILPFSYFKIKERMEINQLKEISEVISEVSSRLLHDEEVKSFSFGDKEISTSFYFNEELESYIIKQMKLYTSKATAVVVMNNSTGEVLSLLSYDKERNTFGRSLALMASNPSASLSKIVAAADLIENAGYFPWTNIKTRGKGTTLYKYQLKKEHRWNRNISLEKAFAYSNNAAFGKAVILNSNATSLFDMAKSFGFNSSIAKFLKLPKSTFRMPTSEFNLAELASGFNTETMISPLHAAVFASIVANNGVLIKPRIVKELAVDEHSLIDEIPDNKKRGIKVLDEETAIQLKQLMGKTIKYGTAKKSFRGMRRDLKRKLEIGGKTGSITGGIPAGKRDWFTSYSKLKDSENSGISVTVMSIQGDKWRAKSSYLAKNIIEYYYKRIKKDDLTKRVFAKK